MAYRHIGSWKALKVSEVSTPCRLDAFARPVLDRLISTTLVEVVSLLQICVTKNPVLYRSTEYTCYPPSTLLAKKYQTVSAACSLESVAISHRCPLIHYRQLCPEHVVPSRATSIEEASSKRNRPIISRVLLPILPDPAVPYRSKRNYCVVGVDARGTCSFFLVPNPRQRTK